MHVPYVLPGETVRLSVCGSKADLLEVLTPAPARISPVCAHFGPAGDQCGGCSLQHLSTDTYTDWKKETVMRALAHVGLEKIDVLAPLLSPLRSRRRASFSVQETGGDILCGFLQGRSHRLIDLQECHILSPALMAGREEIITILEPVFRERPGLRLSAHVTEASNGLDVELTGDLQEEDLSLHEREQIPLLLEATSITRLTINGAPFWQGEQPVVIFAGTRVPLPPRAFLQATKAGEATLQKLVGVGIGGARKVADLFAGCGTFTFAAVQGATVHAVESDEAAINAINQARRLSGQAVTTRARDLFRQPLMPAELNRFDAVVLDPPRAGAEAQAQQLAESNVPVVVSVSCNPKTFARDAATLMAGGYRLSEVQPVDQFMFSPHIEVVGIFTRE